MTGSIVLNVCAECGISSDEFFGKGRKQPLVDARRKAIVALHDAGFSYLAISHLIRRRYSTVMYWVHPQYRERRISYYKKYHQEHPQPRTKWLSDIQKRRLLDAYLNGGFQVAKPIAISLGINPTEISRYAREAGIKNKIGRPRKQGSCPTQSFSGDAMREAP